MVPIAHQFNPNAIEKQVMVFAPTEELQREATEAGAKLVGGEELIEEIKKGRVELVSACWDKFGFSRGGFVKCFHLSASTLQLSLGRTVLGVPAAYRENFFAKYFMSAHNLLWQ